MPYMAICVTTETPGIDTDTSVRVMRWTYSRDHETVVCELGLNGDNSAYELRIAPPWNPLGALNELFDDALAAFHRHTAIERALVQDGWSLESFTSERVPR